MNSIERIYPIALVWKKWRVKEQVRNTIWEKVVLVQTSISLKESAQKRPSEFFFIFLNQSWLIRTLNPELLPPCVSSVGFSWKKFWGKLSIYFLKTDICAFLGRELGSKKEKWYKRTKRKQRKKCHRCKTISSYIIITIITFLEGIQKL